MKKNLLRPVYAVYDRFKFFRFTRFFYRAFIALRYRVIRRPKKPIFIVSAPRVGSHLLRSCLNSIPEVSLKNEILNPYVYYGLPFGPLPRSVVERHLLHSINDCKHESCGAKFITDQLEAHGVEVDDLARLFPSARFIVLYRQNFTNQYISLQLAVKTGEWVKKRWKGTTQDDIRFTLVPADYLRIYEWVKIFYARVLHSPAIRNKGLVLSYEELLRDTQRVFDERIFPFLGRPRCEVSGRITKQNSRERWEIIENYEEVKTLIEDERYILDYSRSY